ncbi:hypothetical protein [Gordonia sp. NPDC003950]
MSGSSRIGIDAADLAGITGAGARVEVRNAAEGKTLTVVHFPESNATNLALASGKIDTYLGPKPSISYHVPQTANTPKARDRPIRGTRLRSPAHVDVRRYSHPLMAADAER